MHEVLHPKHWKPARGYSNGIAAEGRLVVTGGIIGWNAPQEIETDDFLGHGEQGVRYSGEVRTELRVLGDGLVGIGVEVADDHCGCGEHRSHGRPQPGVEGAATAQIGRAHV